MTVLLGFPTAMKLDRDTATHGKILNDVDVAEKPLKTQKKRVDINILKSKLEETEAKELKKNIFILSLLIIGVGSFGIYLSF